MYLFASLLLHAAILFAFAGVWVSHAKHEKQPSMYVPSYTYNEPSHSAAAQSSSSQPRQKTQPSKDATASKSKQATSLYNKPMVVDRSNAATKVAEAIHLVGDKNTVPKPLIKLLGKALAAHLVYPKSAIDFRLRGTSVVGFVLHPDGTLTNIELLESSRAGVLDNEALAAVNAVSPLQNAGMYVTKPEPMIIGIIFN